MPEKVDKRGKFSKATEELKAERVQMQEPGKAKPKRKKPKSVKSKPKSERVQ